MKDYKDHSLSEGIAWGCFWIMLGMFALAGVIH